MAPDTKNPYRLLPKVDEVLDRSEVGELASRVPRELLARYVGEVLDRWREEIAGGKVDAEGIAGRLERGDLLRLIEKRVEREEGSGYRRAINVSGVVLHTGLGRAPVHPEAAHAMEEAARSYGVLEVDRYSGERNQRDDRLSELLCRLSGAQAGICVNNNAAAVVLLLSTFASGRETVVSRGELVEIGGSFRMPDVMAKAGTRLVEVGTTNRTRVEDFRRASNDRTGLFFKVHTSNYRVVGFTEEIEAVDLARLGRELRIATAFDLGSGRIKGRGARSLDLLGPEPYVRDAVASGVDVVTFSGDKLLGGPQAGLIVGGKKAVGLMRKNPLYRALRLDKVAIAGLERTLELYLAGRGDEVPARAMMLRSAEDTRADAELIASEIDGLPGFGADVVEDGTQPGSGAAPDVLLPGFSVRITRAPLRVDALSSRLRANDPPVFARITDDTLRLDPRTLLRGERDELVAAFRRLADIGR